MKNISVMLCGVLGIVGLFISSAASAERIGVGFYIGGPYPYGYYRPFYRPYYPYPYYPPVVVAPPPVVVAPEQAPVYVEQASPQQPAPQQSAPQASGHWYHCDKPEGYYPYIKECPGGWKPVEPVPPANSVPAAH